MLSARVCVCNASYFCNTFGFTIWQLTDPGAQNQTEHPRACTNAKNVTTPKKREREREVLLHAQSVSWSCIIVQNSVAAAQHSVVEAEDKLTYE